MSIKKKVVITFGVLAGLLIAALVLIVMNMDWLVKTAIEKYGSQVTKTAVRVSSVAFHLTAGEGKISGLTVANPKGFSAPHVFSLGKISTKIETRSVLTSPLVIQEIRISAPEVFYEMNSSRVSNIDVLKRNIQEATAGTPQKAPEEKKERGQEKKLIIKKLIIENGRVDVRIAALRDKPMTLTLQKIELNNIGGEKGTTPSQLAKHITSALMDEAGRAVQAGLKRELKKGVGQAVKQFLQK